MPEELSLETTNITGVEVLKTGTWNRRDYSTQDLDALVQSFEKLQGTYQPFGKIGHLSDQKYNEPGQPAVGWITSLYRRGASLYADFKEVPAKVADLIEAGAYKMRSAEIWFDKEIDGVRYPAILKAVAWLGADVPAVSGMSNAFDMYEDEDGDKVAIALMDMTFDQTRESVHAALAKKYPPMEYSDDEYADNEQRLTSHLPEGAKWDGPSCYICDIYDDHVIVYSYDYTKYYSLTYAVDDYGKVELGDPMMAMRTYETMDEPEDELEEYSVGEEAQRLLARLELEEAGKQGSKIAGGYLKRAISAMGDVTSSGTPDVEVQNVTVNITRSEEESPAEEESMQDEEIRAVLGLSEEADIKQALIGLKARQVDPDEHQKLEQERDELLSEKTERTAEATVDLAMQEGKVTKAQRDWAIGYAKGDPKGFGTYVDNAPTYVELDKEHGADSDEGDPEDGAGQETAEQREVREKMGIPAERLTDSRTLAERLDTQREEAQKAPA